MKTWFLLFLTIASTGWAEENIDKAIVEKLRQIVSVNESLVKKYEALAEEDIVTTSKVFEAKTVLWESKIDLAMEEEDWDTALKSLENIKQVQERIVEARRLQFEMNRGDTDKLVEAKRNLLETEVRHLRIQKKRDATP